MEYLFSIVLLVHVLALGALSNAILIWSWHFTAALVRLSDEVVRNVSRYRATNMVWIGSDTYGSLIVYGFGEKKTPKPFVDACDKFIYTEILRPADTPGPSGETWASRRDAM